MTFTFVRTERCNVIVSVPYAKGDRKGSTEAPFCSCYFRDFQVTSLQQELFDRSRRSCDSLIYVHILCFICHLIVFTVVS